MHCMYLVLFSICKADKQEIHVKVVKQMSAALVKEQ